MYYSIKHNALERLSEMRRIGFIGVGNMAKAILRGILRNGDYCVRVYDVNPDKTAEFLHRDDVVVADSLEDLASNSEYIVLAVKPQNMADLLADLRSCVRPDTPIISIAAGVSIRRIRALLCNEKAKVIRVMPNTPMTLGCGAIAICAADDCVGDGEYEVAASIFRASGLVERITEDLMNAITSINGSGPAYFFLFARAAFEFARRYNIPPETACSLFSATMTGSAKMLTDSGMTPEELIAMVSSPGGTTVEALKVFADRGFEETIRAAMTACAERAAELDQ